MKYVTRLVFAVTLVVGLMSCAGSKADKGAKAEAGALEIPAMTGNEKIDDKALFIGRVQINLNDGKKRRFLYFQSDYQLVK